MRIRPLPLACLFAFLLLVLADADARAADPNAAPAEKIRKEPMPPEMRGVGIDEKLGGQLPLNAEFVDSTGKTVKLRDYFDGERPVIVTLNYYRCPQLCTLQLNAFIDTLKQMPDWVPGKQFEVVTISFDPMETPRLASIKRDNYLQLYGNRDAVKGWHFLTGDADAVNAALDATGFKIKWNEERREWAHTAALIIGTPEGVISRYLYGLIIHPKTLRLSLVEASEGEIGSTVDRVLLTCFFYDPDLGAYQASALGIMRLGGLAVLLVVGVLLAILWRAEFRRRRQPRNLETANA